MPQKILHFIKYNNAFTVIIFAFFFSFGISYAANPDVRESVYASTETIISADNRLIISADLDNFNFNLRIASVTEDEKNYYATYSYQTLAVENGVWQSKEMEKVLTVSKEALGDKDLGLYLAQELGENINYELAYLKRVQKLEKEKGESQKVVNVAYSGLIGKLLDPKEKVIEGYDPVIPEPVPEVIADVESNPQEVIVSTVHVENPQTPPPQSEPEATSTPNQSSPSSSDTGQAPPQTEPEPEPEPEATSTPNQTPDNNDTATTTLPAEPVQEPEETPLPEPEDMVDEELIQEVVEELLEPVADEPEIAPAPEEIIPEPEAEATQ